MRFRSSADPTSALVAASHLACIATFAALLFEPWPVDGVVAGALLACFATMALAANAVRRRTGGVHQWVFGALTAIAVAGAVSEAQHLLAPNLAVLELLHSGTPLEVAVVIAALNAVLSTYGTHAAAEHRRAAEDLERRVSESTVALDDAQRVLGRMWWLGQQITLELDPRRVMERFLEAAVDIAHADAGGLIMLTAEGQLRLTAVAGVPAALIGTQGPLRGSALESVIRARKVWQVDDLQERVGELRAVTEDLLSTEGMRALALVPLTHRSEHLGLVAVASRTPGRFRHVDLDRVAAMGDLLSVALANAELVESLRQAEWRFRTLFRAAPDAVLTVFTSGRVRDANDAVRDVVGLEPAHVVGRLLTDLVAPEDGPRLEEALRRAFAGAPERLEVTLLPPALEGVPRAADGARPSRRISFALSQLPEADPPSVLLVGRDITAEREMRARLMESDRLAAVGELVAGVAHEVNNPLSSISAFAQLLLRDPSLSETQRESIEVIRSETTRASQVVKDLLAFARRSDPQREPIDLNAVVSRTLRLRQYQLDANDVRVETALAEDLPAVIGDGRQLQQVCLNLLTNAIQAVAAVGGGSIRLVTRGEGDAVLLEVTDTGGGIPAEIRARIFEPFFTTKGEGEGTGLGLSVSYGIVTAHGGAIAIADTSGRGTTFRVTLPSAAGRAEGGARQRDSGKFQVRSPIAGLRILFVDDEPALRSSMEAYGELRGFTVITAADGAGALAALEDTAVDGIVCDLRMPGVDGLAFHEQLRVSRPGLAARTVFITGDVVTTATRVSTRQPIVTKPFGFEQLEDVLTALVRGVQPPAGTRSGIAGLAAPREPERIG